MKVTVIRALPERQWIVELDLERGATAGAAANASGLGGPDALLGVAGRRVEPAQRLEEGDRIEILRPLVADPNEARRRRARRQKAGG
jgi:putative ubiquitin-RnfH superfamily antitoxin RatB of RatAB toxin-antitoxin module